MERALDDAGIDVPLLVLRGDGGAMSLEAFRRRAVAARSAPARPREWRRRCTSSRSRDAIVLECGGTSSNVSVVKGGRTVLRTLRVMGRPTCDPRRSTAGSSAPPAAAWRALGRRRIDEAGPRSAHVAGLPYACFAAPERARTARALELIAPRPGDPEHYAVVARRDGRRYALTATCAAQRARARRRTALRAGLARGGARRVRRRWPRGCGRAAEAARARCWTAPSRRSRRPWREARRTRVRRRRAARRARRRRPRARAEVARRLGPRAPRREHPEVLSSIGAALSLVRARSARHAPPSRRGGSRSPARPSAPASTPGAAPPTVASRPPSRRRERLLRAVATGAVALEAGAADARGRSPTSRAPQRPRPALGLDGARLELVAENDFYRVFSGNGTGRRRGGRPARQRAARRERQARDRDDPAGLLEQLAAALRDGSLNLGVATLLPRVALVCGPRLVDLSDARRPRRSSPWPSGAGRARRTAVAVIWR